MTMTKKLQGLVILAGLLFLPLASHAFMYDMDAVHLTKAGYTYNYSKQQWVDREGKLIKQEQLREVFEAELLEEVMQMSVRDLKRDAGSILRLIDQVKSGTFTLSITGPMPVLPPGGTPSISVGVFLKENKVEKENSALKQLGRLATNGGERL